MSGTTTSTNPNQNPNFLSTPASLTQTLVSFLTVVTHHILYLRRIYPARSFLSTRAYNYPVRQSRHPRVCEWILSAVAAVEDQLTKSTVREISILIFGVETNQVYERWRIDLTELPDLRKDGILAGEGEGGSIITNPKKVADVPFDRQEHANTESTTSLGPDTNIKSDAASSHNLLRSKIAVADLEAHFRAVLSRISTTASRLSPLPNTTTTDTTTEKNQQEAAATQSQEGEECTFTISISVRDDADRPVGILEKEERKWIAAEPEPWQNDREDADDSPDSSSLSSNDSVSSISSSSPSLEQRRKRRRRSTKRKRSRTRTRTRRTKNNDGGGSGDKTIPIRRLEAGELRMEVWVEESRAKRQK